jgi:hypothetical protein
MNKNFGVVLGLAALVLAGYRVVLAEPDGNATIRAPAGGSEIVIKTTARTAGAIDSLTWKGREFIDSHDHGRQLQSASNLDAGAPITAETFNPTEAGSRRDCRGTNTTSRLLFLRAASNELQTVAKMAFWLAPGEKSGPNPAKNTTVLSQHLLKKQVVIGYKNLPHVIAYDVTFPLPWGEQHTHAVFEALTGYMPPEFEQFFSFKRQTGDLEPLSDGPGEVPDPVVLSTADGAHAMGIYAPPQPAPNTTGPTFGRWRFTREKVVKWNCVFRVINPQGVAPGDYTFRMFVAVGDRATVCDSLRALYQEFKDAK